MADGRVHWNKKDDAVLLKLKKAGDAVSAIRAENGSDSLGRHESNSSSEKARAAGTST